MRGYMHCIPLQEAFILADGLSAGCERLRLAGVMVCWSYMTIPFAICSRSLWVRCEFKWMIVAWGFDDPATGAYPLYNW